MTTSDRERWDAKYSQREPASNIAADDWLIRSCNTIAESSTSDLTSRRAIDIACGLGHNSIWLARQGWTVDGVDVSSAGLNLARQSAEQAGCNANWLQADLDDWSPVPDSYDLAIVFRFLDRETVPRIINAGLRSGGWLIYETFAAGQLDRPDSHIRNPAFTLAPGELPALFRDFDVLDYQDNTLANRTVQQLLARRR